MISPLQIYAFDQPANVAKTSIKFDEFNLIFIYLFFHLKFVTFILDNS